MSRRKSLSLTIISVNILLAGSALSLVVAKSSTLAFGLRAAEIANPDRSKRSVLKAKLRPNALESDLFLPTLTTASGMPVSRYALGGAARSIQPESLASHYQSLLSSSANIGVGGAPFYFYYNPHRYPDFLSGVARSFFDDSSAAPFATAEAPQDPKLPHRKNVFIASGSPDRSPDALDQRLTDALAYSGGIYLDAFVLEYVCPEELTSINAPTRNFDAQSAKLGNELSAAINHVRSYVAQGKVRYLMASTHSHVVGAVMASASLPLSDQCQQQAEQHSPAFDALLLRYNLSHKKAAESLSLSAALHNNIPVIAFTTTRWNRLQKKDVFTDRHRKKPSTVDCIKFALQHPAVEVVLHSARDEKELEETLSPLLSSSLSQQSNWLLDDDYEFLRAYGSAESEWNIDDRFDEYPEEGSILS